MKQTNKYKKNPSLLQNSVPFPSPSDVGLNSSSSFHQEAPEQSKSTAQTLVQNQKTAERARKKKATRTLNKEK